MLIFFLNFVFLERKVSLFEAGNPNLVLCDNLEGWCGEGGGWEVQEGGTYIYLWLIHVDVWQKPSEYCEVFIF